LKGDHQRIILAKLESNWPSSLRGKKLKFHPRSDLQPTWSLLLKIKNGDEIKKIFNSETTGPIGNTLCLVLWSGLSDTFLEGDYPRTIPPKFGLKWPSGFRGKYF
jgi:hypothetical protein